MSTEGRDLAVLRYLASMPFLDRLELAAASGRSEGAAHEALFSLRREGLVEPVRHAAPLTASTRRFCVSAEGVDRLARDEDVSLDRMLRRHPVSAHWRRVLLERLDAAVVMYRLASAVADVGGPLRFRWYRAMPLDAGIVLADGRTLGVVRLGATVDRTAVSDRVWRLLSPNQRMPGALLAVAPDEVRLRHAGRLLARAPVSVYMALEEDVAGATADDPVWRVPLSEKTLDLRSALSYIRRVGALPSERRLSSASLPDDLVVSMPERDVPGHLLPVVLKPRDKRMLDRISEWPWITPADLGGILGLLDSVVSKLTARLHRLGLVSRVDLEGRRRLALSDRGLAMLARRDRTSVATALKRWSVEPISPRAPVTWRNVSGARSRHLARHIGHTEAVHRFMASLVRQAESTGDHPVVRLDPPHHAVRYFRHGGTLRSVHPDGFGIVRVGGKSQPFFLEWERRAVRPGTMASRLAPYLAYFSTRHPVDDHGAMPILLVVFDDPLAEARFLGIVREQVKQSRVGVPLWVSHRRVLEEVGPLGPAWRNFHSEAPVHAFGERLPAGKAPPERGQPNMSYPRAMHAKRRTRTGIRLRSGALWRRLALIDRSQNWLAREVGVTPGHLSMLVNGRRCASPRVSRRIQRVLGVDDFDDLFEMQMAGSDA